MAVGTGRRQAAGHDAAWRNLSAARGIDPAIAIAVLAVTVSQVADEQPAQSSGSGAHKRPRTTIDYPADDCARCRSRCHVSFGGGAARQRGSRYHCYGHLSHCLPFSVACADIVSPKPALVKMHRDGA
jgi:hypothetical protein